MKVFHGSCDNWRPKINYRFDSVRRNHLEATQHKLAMEEESRKFDIGLKDANVKNLKKRTDNVTKSNKCNQCDFASS